MTLLGKTIKASDKAVLKITSIGQSSVLQFGGSEQLFGKIFHEQILASGSVQIRGSLIDADGSSGSAGQVPISQGAADDTVTPGWIWGTGGSGGGVVTSIANNTDGNILTAGGGTILNGESNLTFDGTDLTLGSGDLYGKSVNADQSKLYKFGGLYLTWDSDSYGTDLRHSITSTDDTSFSDSITINSFDKVRINIDSNNNNNPGNESTFSVGHHTSGIANTLLNLTEAGALTLSGSAAKIELNDSDTVIKESSTGNTVRIESNYGYVEVGPKNNSYSHFYTDKPRYYFNKPIVVAGSVEHSRLGSYGTYDVNQVQGIWSIGNSFTIDTTADDFGSQYGMGYAYNQNGGSPFASEHQIVFTNNGVVNAAIGLGGSGYFGSNVGIGTTTPTDKLQVVGAISASSHINLNAGQRYSFRNRTDLGMFEDTFNLQLSAPNDVIVMIDSNDNFPNSARFEIRKLSPTVGGGTEILSVNGDGDLYTTGNIGRDSTDYISFTNNTQADIFINNSNEFRFRSNGDFHADNDVIAFSSTISSDKRLKENIVDTKYGLNDVLKLRGVDFNWKEKRNKRQEVGFIAQEVQEVVPELVKEVDELNSEEKFLTVDYAKLVPVLVEAIKDQQEQINQLKKQIESK